MVTELLQKYIWLIRTFIRAGERGLSLNELRDRWESRFTADYPRRTFNNHREAIEEIFGIRIECDRSSNRYFIRYSDDVSDQNASSAWLINTFTVSNLLSLGKERLSGRISVEDVPSGHKYLTTAMEAMLDCNILKIKYRKYSSDRISSYTVKPYAIKEDSKRWYLVGYCDERQSIRVYGLDRILDMTATEEKFKLPAGFDVDRLFSTSYGVYLSDEKPCRILFRTSKKEAEYLRDLPIHHSQKEISRDDDSSTFSIFVSANNNLLMDLWRLGGRIEIISPEGIRRQFAEETKKMLDIYGITNRHDGGKEA